MIKGSEQELLAKFSRVDRGMASEPAMLDRRSGETERFPGDLVVLQSEGKPKRDHRPLTIRAHG